MKQIVVISGKGGTGKTVITAAFAALAKNAVFADCDVDAADLHLLLHPQVIEKNNFTSGYKFSIDKAKCINCGKCKQLCRFDAIGEDNSKGSNKGRFFIDNISCEGCSLCQYICPVQAISKQESVCGQWYISNTRFGYLIHAKLGIAEENSGKLVSLVKTQAKQLAENKNKDWVIIDGTPGIGCPLVASISGVDCAVVVTEPTLSGLHDAKRVIDVAKYFNVPVQLIINKYDLNREVSQKIVTYCKDNNIPLLGKIKFDKAIVEAMVQSKTIIEAGDSFLKQNIISIWEKLQKIV